MYLNCEQCTARILPVAASIFQERLGATEDEVSLLIRRFPVLFGYSTTKVSYVDGDGDEGLATADIVRETPQVHRPSNIAHLARQP